MFFLSLYVSSFDICNNNEVGKKFIILLYDTNTFLKHLIMAWNWESKSPIIFGNMWTALHCNFQSNITIKGKCTQGLLCYAENPLSTELTEYYDAFPSSLLHKNMDALHLSEKGIQVAWAVYYGEQENAVLRLYAISGLTWKKRLENAFPNFWKGSFQSRCVSCHLFSLRLDAYSWRNSCMTKMNTSNNQNILSRERVRNSLLI